LNKNLLLRTLALASIATSLAGCGSSGPVSQLPIAPLVASVSGTRNPQVASYSVTPHMPAKITIKFGEDANYGFVTSETRADTGEAAVPILVAGMKANTTYHMRAFVEYDNGSSQTDIDRTFATGALPVLPAFTVTPTPGMTPQPGVELVNSLGTPTQFASDVNGNVVWTYVPSDQAGTSYINPIKLLPNGHFALLFTPLFNVPLFGPVPDSMVDVLREIDLAGNTVRELNMKDLNAALAAGGFNITLGVFSHDFAALPNGHILVIANVVKSFNNLPGHAGTTKVLGDAVVDLDSNFKPVWLWNAFDNLDVNRQPMGFPDWTHANAIIYSPDDGNFLISLRHQHWVLKVDYRDGAGTGKTIWKLGRQGDFALQGAVDPTDWFYAQHDPSFVSSNTTGSFKLAIMDNGDNRAFPSNVTCNAQGAPPCLYTTIPIMQVDENAKTASFVFHDILAPDLYSYFAGSTRVLPNANVEYDLAGLNADSKIFEVTPTATPQIVWQMHLINSNAYRSFRIPSLYPGVQW
jgi:arylsulfate sulfotransferase